MSDILVTICARGGSKGVPGKNLKELAGKPLIAHTIETAKKWGKAKRIIVSTDSEEIRETSISFGAEAPFLRPENLSNDTAPKLPAIKHALIETEKKLDESFDYILDLDPTAPIRTLEDLDNSFELFKKKNWEQLLSVTKAHKNPYFNMLELNENGAPHICKPLPSNLTRRQDAPEVYSANASIYIYKRAFLLEEKYLIDTFSPNSGVYIMNDLSGWDIDRELDFEIVDYLISKKKVVL